MSTANDKFLLEAFLKQYSGFQESFSTSARVDYRKFSIDSRKITAGQLFIAIRGENHDAHSFIPDVIEKDAGAIVVARDWFDSKGTPDNNFIVVGDTLDFLQQLAVWHRRHFRIPVIGITGSNGKTTTRAMISSVLRKRYKLLATEGNKNNHIGLPLTLLELKDEHQMAVVEMGSNHPGEIALLASLARPTSGVITNIGKGHYGYFGSLIAVYKEKTALFDAVKTGGALFLNDEDPLLREYQREDCRLIRIGKDDSCEVSGRILSTDENGCIRIRLDSQIDIQLAVPGRHQLPNALMATAVARFAGITDGDIREQLEAFQPATQRMQMTLMKGIRIINDAYNSNPDSMRAAIDFLDGLPNNSGKKWIAIGDMLEMGEFAADEHLQIGAYLASKKIDGVLLYGPMAAQIRIGMLEAEFEDSAVSWHTTHQELANKLSDLMSIGDIILLKGSRGMQMEKVIDLLQLG